jgi:hypothetical protein
LDGIRICIPVLHSVKTLGIPHTLPGVFLSPESPSGVMDIYFLILRKAPLPPLYKNGGKESRQSDFVYPRPLQTRLPLLAPD